MVVEFAAQTAAPPVQVVVNLRFELFYSLQHALAAEPGAGTAKLAAPVPNPAVLRAHAALGKSPLLWIVANDALAGLPADAGIDAIVAALDGLTPGAFVRRVLGGLLHSDELAGELLAAELEPRIALAAIAAAVPAKRAWLSHVGLYPYRADAAIARTLNTLIADPAAAKARVREAVVAYWRDSFAGLWTALAPDYAAAERRLAAAAELDVAAGAAGLGDLFRRLALPAEYDEPRAEIRARRGGYRLAIADTAAICLMPSAFNAWRVWTVDDSGAAGTVACFPVPDADLARAARGAERDIEGAGEPRLDLVFRALGKDVRLAIADLLARRPHTAGELAAALEMPKSTLSHHLFLLREADLLAESAPPGGRRLSLKREPFERLGAQALARFFPPPEPPGPPA